MKEIISAPEIISLKNINHMKTLYTFGDSVLDCGGYNVHGVTPGALIVKNDDRLFPEFRGRDLASRGQWRLEHRAVDGSTVAELLHQAQGLKVEGPAIALVTIGGNDLLAGLAWDEGPGVDSFALALDQFLLNLPIRPVLLGNVYDPTFGDDDRNFLNLDPALGRSNLRRVNERIAAAAARHGRLVDLHAHFLSGDPSWLTMTIEPSLRGASEIRRCFLEAIEQVAAAGLFLKPMAS
jgi:acyl-CoA thioesterase I